jgi:hypothetical protein
MVRVLPGVTALIPIDKFDQIPVWEVTWIIPIALVTAAIILFFQTWIGARWLRWRIRRLAPDLERLLDPPIPHQET